MRLTLKKYDGEQSAGCASLQAVAVITTALALLLFGTQTLADVSPATSDQKRQVLNRYTAEVLNMESSRGAYDPDLSEALLGQGEAQQRLGRHQDAITAFERAAHITRINEGLYSPAVLPLVENMVDSYAQLGQWDAVDNQHNFMMQINAESYGWDDQRMLPILEKLSSWHMYAFFERLTSDPVRQLQLARSLYARAANVIQVNFGNADLRMAKQLRGRRVADFYLAKITQLEVDQQQRQERFRRYDARGDFGQMTSTRAIPQGYVSGLRTSRALLELYQRSPDAPTADKAEAVAELGDWYLLFGKNRSAMNAYQEAYNMLGDSAEHLSAREKMFAKPKALDLGQDYESYLGKADNVLPQGYVLFDVDLSTTGAIRQARFVEEFPRSPSMQYSANRELQSRRFRPKIVDGKAVATDGMRYRYRYSYTGQTSSTGTAPDTDTGIGEKPVEDK